MPYMKNNINKLIGSIIIFGLAVIIVFAYAFYGAGKKAAEDQQAANGTSPVSAVDTSQSTQDNSVSQNTQTAQSAPTPVISQSNQGGDDSSSGDDDSRSAPAQTAPTPVKPISTPVSTPAPVATRKQTVYKNGTYIAVGSYQSPAGTEQISVTVTLVNDVITNTSAVSMANDRTSSRYESRFIGGYASQIVGKNIDTVQLSYVSGSSLTPSGFNDALSKIKSSARA